MCKGKVSKKMKSPTKWSDNCTIDAASKKRFYNMNRNRINRKLEAEEKERLKQEIFLLENELLNYKYEDDYNIWKDTFEFLNSQLNILKYQKNQIKIKIKKNESIIRILGEWIKRSTSNFYQGCLMAHESSRQIAFDWILRRLSNHIEIIRNQFKLFQSIPYTTCMLTPFDRSYRMELWHQRIEAFPMELISSTVLALHVDPLQTRQQVLLSNPRKNMQYIRRPAAFSGIHPSACGLTEQVLVCQLRKSTSLSVICSHSITYDGSMNCDEITRDWTRWTIIQSIGDGECHVMDVTMACGLRHREQYLPLELDTTLQDPQIQWNVFQESMQAAFMSIHQKEVDTMRLLL